MRPKIDVGNDEWIDFVNGKFVDLSPRPWDEDRIKEDWETSNSKFVNSLFDNKHKGALYNWADMAIVMARLMW